MHAEFLPHDEQPPSAARIELASEGETEAFGRAIAAACRPGLVFAFNGDLGAGKTRLTRAIALGLGADPALVSSPTFSLIQVYPARIDLAHCDAYRLQDIDEFYELGVEETLFDVGVAIVEWAERIDAALPEDHLEFRLRATADNAREVDLASRGPASAAFLADLQQVLARGGET